MAMRYLKDSQDFKFPSSFGFSGSSTGTDSPLDHPLTPEQQGLEFGLKGNFDGGDDGTYVAKLARGGQSKKRPAASRKLPALPTAPGPAPAPAMSPMAQAMAMPGASRAMAAQPPVQPNDGMAMGGRMRKARGGRACYDSGGGADSGDGPTAPRRMAPASTDYADENDRRGTPGRFYAGEAERGRMGDRKGSAEPKAAKAPAARPLPKPPAYEPPPRSGTVSVDVRPRRPDGAPAARKPSPGYVPDSTYTFGAADGGHLSAKDRQSLPRSDFALPGNGAGPKGAGSGSYPINTPGHARAALARGAANASPAQQATIRRKVEAKYPDMKVKG